MDNNLQVIHEQVVLGQGFKVYGDIENPLFLARDVAEWIDYARTSKGSPNVSMMLNSIDIDEKLVSTLFISGQNRRMWFVTEDGLYEVLMQSRKPIAKSFKKQVKEILKTLRKTGGFISNTDLMVETYFGALGEDKKMLVKGLFENIEKQQRLIQEQKPLVTFAERCIASGDTILIRELAKVAYEEGINIGERRLYQKLRDWGLIMKGKTEPTQRAMEMGLFEVSQRTIAVPSGDRLARTTRVSPKGQIYIIERLSKEA